MCFFWGGPLMPRGGGDWLMLLSLWSMGDMSLC